jgi:hypothetical protein
MHTVSLTLTAILAFSVAAEAQITVTPMGNLTDISGPSGQSSTQVDLGNGHGVIITDQSTTPYTVLGQPSAPSQLGVPPVPSAPQFGAPAVPSSPAPLFLPGSGSDSTVIILGK